MRISRKYFFIFSDEEIENIVEFTSFIYCKLIYICINSYRLAFSPVLVIDASSIVSCVCFPNYIKRKVIERQEKIHR